MPNNRIMVAGEKESFLIRVLIKKLKDTGYDAYFASWNINEINAGWEQAAMIALYAEERQHPGDDTLVFLKDKLSEDHKVITIICVDCGNRSISFIFNDFFAVIFGAIN